MTRVVYYRSILASDAARYVRAGWRAVGVDVKPSVADFLILMESESGEEPGVAA